MTAEIYRDFWIITTYEIGGNHKGQIISFKGRFSIVHFPWNSITYIIFNTKLYHCVFINNCSNIYLPQFLVIFMEHKGF